MNNKVLTHLMFEGNAHEAMTFYVGLLPESRILTAQYYEEGDNKGKVMQARFELGGREFICIDSPIAHQFTFTPSMSIFVEFNDESVLKHVFEQLADGGTIMMPLDNYGFSSLFGWVSDRFGVSWQLNLE